jgi:hypothetical protein
MSEWWTYRPSDFLMFSARTYARMLELYNQEVWPLQFAWLVIGIGLIVLAARGPRESSRWIASCLALAWLWVAWAFHWQRYSDINTAGRWFAAAFAVQAFVLLLAAISGSRSAPVPGPIARYTGLALAVAGVLLYPLLALASGRPLHQAEVFGLVPEPTALATVGLLLATPQRYRTEMLPIPLLALALGATTWWLLFDS